jgi:hypothetical protein
MGLIRLSSLLPSSLYFSFSEAFTDDVGTFLIPRPAMERVEFCRTQREAGFRVQGCPTQNDSEYELTPAQQQALLEAALEAQSQLILDAEQGNLQFPASDAIEKYPRSNILTDAEEFPDLLAEQEEREQVINAIKGDLSYSSNLDAVVEARASRLANLLMGSIESRFDAQASSLSDVNQEEEQEESSSGETDVDLESTVAAFYRAETRVITERIPPGGLRVPRVSGSQLARLIEESRYNPSSQIMGLLREQLVPEIKERYVAALRSEGLDLDARRAAFEAAVMKTTGVSYLAALGIRLAIPLIVGFVLAAMLGTEEIASIALGAALAAFLLAWPVAVLWQGVVAGRYHDLRTVFLLFYACYVASFGTLAWLGAVIGARARQRIKKLGGNVAAPAQVMPVVQLAKSLPALVFVNLATNGATIVLSLIFFGHDVGYENY